MRFRKLLAAILVVAAVSTTALAVVIQLERTPENPGDFSVTSEMGKDGLVHFAVTCKVARPCWIQAYLVVRKGETRIVETHFPAVVREDSIEYSITYNFAISPEYLDDSTLELAERGIGYSVNAADERHPLPGTGGTDNVFQLKKFASKAPAKGPPAAIAIKAPEVLENLKKYDAIYESGFSASGTEEGKDLMELRFNSFLGVKRRWMLTYADDRFGYTEEVIGHEKLKYQELVERRRQGTTRGLREIGPTSDQDEDSVKPLLTSIRTRTWGYWGQDLSGHYYEDTDFEVTPEDKAMERGKYLHTAVHGPADTSMTTSKYVFLYALGRFFSKDLDKVTRVEKSKDGLLVVSAVGTNHRSTLAPYSSGRWELEIEPAAAWMVRKARFYSDAQPQSNWAGVWTEMANSGTVWSGPYCIPKEAIINCFGSINGVETERLTFDPVAGKFDEKLYSTVRQAVGYNKEPSVEVHDYRVSPDTIIQPNRLGKLVSLVGKVLPGFDGIKIDFSPEKAKGRMILVCFWDMNQRPSRQCITTLAEQAGQLKEKGVIIVAIQDTKVDKTALDEWIKKYNISFAVGMIAGKEEEVHLAWGVKALPWLILTDRKHIVIAEDFSFAELEEKIKTITQK